MSKYAVMVPDAKGTFPGSPLVVDDLPAALDAAGKLAAQGPKPKIFQEIEGEIVLTAKLVPINGGAATNGQRPERRPVVIRAAGAKRTAADLQKLRTRILSWVMTHPGKGVEEMATSLQVPTKELVLPIRQLISERKMSKKGQARAVKYFPPKTSAAAKPAKKAA